jgi:hypothetical protein
MLVTTQWRSVPIDSFGSCQVCCSCGLHCNCGLHFDQHCGWHSNPAPQCACLVAIGRCRRTGASRSWKLSCRWPLRKTPWSCRTQRAQPTRAARACTPCPVLFGAGRLHRWSCHAAPHHAWVPLIHCHPACNQRSTSGSFSVQHLRALIHCVLGSGSAGWQAGGHWPAQRPPRHLHTAEAHHLPAEPAGACEVHCLHGPSASRCFACLHRLPARCSACLPAARLPAATFTAPATKDGPGPSVWAHLLRIRSWAKRNGTRCLSACALFHCPEPAAQPPPRQPSRGTERAFSRVGATSARHILAVPLNRHDGHACLPAPLSCPAERVLLPRAMSPSFSCRSEILLLIACRLW